MAERLLRDVGVISRARNAQAFSANPIAGAFVTTLTNPVTEGKFDEFRLVTHRQQPYTPGMQNAEIELKFPVLSLPHLEQSLHALGFHVETPRTFESNTLYDTPERTLRERGELLRVRSYGARNVVTHKRHPDEEDTASIYKVRIETESEVADGDALAEIFTRLGYGPSFRYEKFRTEYADPQSDGHAVVDETPIGIYAELEGPTTWIDRTLVGLGVDPGTCITDSYGRLFLSWKERTGSEAENLTFAEIQVPVMAL